MVGKAETLLPLCTKTTFNFKVPQNPSCLIMFFSAPDDHSPEPFHEAQLCTQCCSPTLAVPPLPAHDDARGTGWLLSYHGSILGQTPPLQALVHYKRLLKGLSIGAAGRGAAA